MAERTTHDLEDIGSIRATNGSAIEVIAGAAKHWEQRALALESSKRNQWRDGFITATVILGGLALGVSVVLHYLG